MTKNKKILLDVDEVICFAGFLPAINEFLGTQYTIDDFTDYYLDEAAIPPNRLPEFNEFISQRNLYENATILPNAIEVISKLNEIYDIYICSACINPFDVSNSGRLFADKYNFLTHELPFLNPNKFIFTSTKHFFKADIQIDDRIDNFDADVPLHILVSSYHNLDIKDEELASKNVIRAGTSWYNTWLDIENILLEKDKN